MILRDWMDLYEIESKIVVEETHRLPLAPSEKNNGAPVVSRKPRTREIMSRYKSYGTVTPTPSAPTVPRRSPSPGVNRAVSTPGPMLPKRSQSAERRRPSTQSSTSLSRPSTPPSLSRPSTPPTDVQISARRLLGNRTVDGLWPAMRSLSVSFQADSTSFPLARKEKPRTHSSSDNALRSSANAAHKQAENVQRKATPERKRTPLRGKNGPEQSENSKPVENYQYRWPGRVSARLSANSMSRSVDLTDRINKFSSQHLPGRGFSPSRNLSSSDGQRGASPTRKMSASDGQRGVSPTKKVSASDGQRGVSPTRKMSASDGQREVSLTRKMSASDGQRRISPMRRMSSSDSQRGVSPMRRMSASDSQRGVSPTRRMPASEAGMSRGLQKSTTEVTRRHISGKNANLIDDMASRTSGSSRVLSASVNISLNPTDRSSSLTRCSRTLSLPLPGLHRPQSPNRDFSSSSSSSSSSRGMPSPARMRPTTPFPSANSTTSRPSSSSSVLSFTTDVRKGKKGANQIEDAHQLRLLYNRNLQWRFMNARAGYALSIQKVTAENLLFSVWKTISKLRGSVIMKKINLQQLRQEMKLNTVMKGQMTHLDDWALLEKEHASSLSGAIKDLEASTLRLPVTGGARVEGLNCLVYELADVATQERAMLDQCGDLLAATSALQVVESSFRTHLIQVREDVHKPGQPISGVEIPG
ncbi:hypothetical protein QJS10_CPB17g00172 [Acorus calamus]|uniref:AUGMIN subunit 8 n=1 Tax=Acorus calamus TaxID=4465 RepID=A0AAV9CWL6_ACOCL|nr:hypothetical protein QJS10_CPB17g00172 [Acorus calamus]